MSAHAWASPQRRGITLETDGFLINKPQSWCKCHFPPTLQKTWTPPKAPMWQFEQPYPRNCFFQSRGKKIRPHCYFFSPVDEVKFSVVEFRGLYQWLQDYQYMLWGFSVKSTVVCLMSVSLWKLTPINKLRLFKLNHLNQSISLQIMYFFDNWINKLDWWPWNTNENTYKMFTIIKEKHSWQTLTTEDLFVFLLSLFQTIVSVHVWSISADWSVFLSHHGRNVCFTSANRKTFSL